MPQRSGFHCDSDSLPELVGASQAIREVKFRISRFASLSLPVLITGETGTGKEVVARLIHRMSARSGREMIAVNCAAIPDTLLESELFGYSRGAFTGALSSQPGKFQLANEGTLFLDEIGDMSLVAQAKILRALERGEVNPLGGRPVQVDTRIVAATNRSLEQRILDGSFREDLFFRLCVANIEIPPLRERPEDVPFIARHFLERVNQTHCLAVRDFTPEAMANLMNHPWPGNVRQLRNVVEAAAITAARSYISAVDLRSLHQFSKVSGIPQRFTQSRRTPVRIKAGPEQLLHELRASNWNVSKTAERLHWARATIYRKMAKYQLMPERQSPSTNRVSSES